MPWLEDYDVLILLARCQNYWHHGIYTRKKQSKIILKNNLPDSQYTKFSPGITCCPLQQADKLQRKDTSLILSVHGSRLKISPGLTVDLNSTDVSYLNYHNPFQSLFSYSNAKAPLSIYQDNSENLHINKKTMKRDCGSVGIKHHHRGLLWRALVLFCYVSFYFFLCLLDFGG